MITRAQGTALLSLAVLLGAGEWLRSPSWLWVLVILGALLLSGALTRRTERRRQAVVLAVGVAMTAAMSMTGRRAAAIQSSWLQVREAFLEDASQRLSEDLADAFEDVDRISRLAAAAADESRGDLFLRLAELVPDEGAERAVTVFETDGAPLAWAGRHRLPPQPVGDSVGAPWNGYYLTLEMRRHSAAGRPVVAAVVIEAAAATASPDGSVAAAFRRRTGAGLLVFPPGAAPADDPDIYDYAEPTTAGPRLLFSVKPVPPEQGAAREDALASGRTVVSWLVLAFLVAALLAAPGSFLRFGLLLGFLLLLLRAPLGAAVGAVELFSPATFFRPLVGPFSTSVGMMAATGTVVTIIGIGLWRRRMRRTWYGVLIGVAALVTAPDLYRELGRGITPPSDGVSLTLWVTWQFMMLVAATGLFAIAAATFRGPHDVTGRGWKIRLGIGVSLALVATMLGTVLWEQGWPPYYTGFWVPALLLVVTPAPRRATAVALAIVAGSAAALVTWGAVLEGAAQVARRDLLRLGSDADPLAVASLERFGRRLSDGPAPATAAQLFERWRESDLGREGYPAHLALWRSDGTLLADLPIDSLSLSGQDVRAAVEALPEDSTTVVSSFALVPGVHHLLLSRVAGGEVVSLAIGPLTNLIPRTPLGAAIDPPPQAPPLYRISMSPPRTDLTPAEAMPMRWHRSGWSLFAEADYLFGDDVHTAMIEVDLRGPLPVFVRGALLLLLDALVIMLLWRLAEWIDGQALARPDWRRQLRSFRVRLAGALALFFMLPAVGFAAWSFVRLSDEVARGRDLLTTHLLRDAVTVGAGTLAERGTWDGGHLVALSRQVNAPFWSYDGGELRAASAPILRDLGIAGPLLPPRVERALAVDPTTSVVIADAVAGSRRVGFRTARVGGPSRRVVLATPQLPYDVDGDVAPFDLALVVLLATLLGLAGALLAARWSARALSRPVADLRMAAAAIGRGGTMPPPSAAPPLEFEPVFGAIQRMEQDIRTSRGELENARRRTAAVLATVATGVIGLDRSGRILIANRRAEEYLGVSLTTGEVLETLAGPSWRELWPLANAVVQGTASDRSAELHVGDRRFSAHCAALGGEGGGAVIALTDVTDLAQAERVLAWGEMARHVAHEIKNPLTPMRLGIQHLQRVQRDQPEALPDVLGTTADRMLGEIDRLNRIARAFSQFATPSDEVAPLENVDLAEVAHEVQQLYEMGQEGVVVRVEVDGPAHGAARRDEVKEVLINLLENAREAHAGTIRIVTGPASLEVRDDGRGMAQSVAARIFEPRFSTTSSGAGLGLAIVRRQVESWGATIGVESREGEGTVFRMALVPYGTSSASDGGADA